MGKNFYICNKDGDVFQYIPQHDGDSSEEVEPVTNYLFSSFQGVNEPVSAFACGSEVTTYTNQNNVWEKEEEQEEQDVVFYIARNSENHVVLSCYSVTGEILSEYELPIYEQILGLESWPNDGSTVVATSSNNVYVIDLSQTPPSILVSETSRPLARGLAYKRGQNNIVRFWVGVQGEFIGIGDLVVYKNSAINYLLDVVPKKLSNNLLGFANSYDRLHAGFITELDTKESNTLLKDYTSGHNYIIPVSAIDIASPVRACAYLPKFEEEYTSIEIQEYDSSTGTKLTNSAPSTFGVIPAGGISKTKVFRLKIPWAKRISNVKLGIVDSDIRFVPGIIKFGTSPFFIPNYEPLEVFSGVNISSISDDINNKNVPVTNSSNQYNMSDFVYLSVEVPDRFFQPGHFQLKWFFDFEAEKEIPAVIPTKICNYNSETYSSESSLSSLSSISSSSVSSESSVCSLEICFKTFSIPDQLTVYIDGSLILDTGMISTGSEFSCWSIDDIPNGSEISYIINAPLEGTAWELTMDGCGIHIDIGGGRGHWCWPDNCSTSSSLGFSISEESGESSESSGEPSGESSEDSEEDSDYVYAIKGGEDFSYGIGLDLL